MDSRVNRGSWRWVNEIEARVGVGAVAVTIEVDLLNPTFARPYRVNDILRLTHVSPRDENHKYVFLHRVPRNQVTHHFTPPQFMAHPLANEEGLATPRRGAAELTLVVEEFRKWLAAKAEESAKQDCLFQQSLSSL